MPPDELSYMEAITTTFDTISADSSIVYFSPGAPAWQEVDELKGDCSVQVPTDFRIQMDALRDCGSTRLGRSFNNRLIA